MLPEARNCEALEGRVDLGDLSESGLRQTKILLRALRINEGAEADKVGFGLIFIKFEAKLALDEAQESVLEEIRVSPQLISLQALVVVNVVDPGLVMGAEESDDALQSGLLGLVPHLHRGDCLLSRKRGSRLQSVKSFFLLFFEF